MKFVKAISFWTKTSEKNGKKYLSGKANIDIKAGTSITVWQNDKGDNAKRPDFIGQIVVEDTPLPADDPIDDNGGFNLAPDEETPPF